MSSSGCSVSQTRQRRVAAGMVFLSFVSLDILRALRLAGVGTLRLGQVAEASSGRFPQPLSMWSGTPPGSNQHYTTRMDLRKQVEAEAEEANRAVAALGDAAVVDALRAAAALVRGRADA